MLALVYYNAPWIHKYSATFVPNLITRKCISCRNTESVQRRDATKPNFTRTQIGTKNFFYLRVIEVDRCRSVEERWCEHDGTYLEDRCHVCGGYSVLCKQQGRHGPDCTGGGGRTSSLLSLPVVAVCCLYLQTNATPSPYSHSPHVRWTFPASSLFPKEFYFSKVESHSLACCQQRANPDSKESERVRGEKWWVWRWRYRSHWPTRA